MKKEIRVFMLRSTILIMALLVISFLSAWFLGHNQLALGLGAGGGLGILEMESSVLIFPLLTRKRAKVLWGALLVGKFLLVLGLLGYFLLGLKLNSLGIIIGFSETVLGVLLMAIYFWIKEEGK